jgi:hypothetical protein
VWATDLDVLPIDRVQVAARDERFEAVSHRTFCRARLEDLRALFEVGRGAWYVAVDPSAGEALWVSTNRLASGEPSACAVSAVNPRRPSRRRFPLR